MKLKEQQIKQWYDKVEAWKRALNNNDKTKVIKEKQNKARSEKIHK